MFTQVIEDIKKYKRIIIHRHTNPDGDAIGSQVGLKHIIKTNFPEKEVYAVGDMTKRYSFMDDCRPDEIEDEIYKDSLAIILDTSARSLISDSRYSLADKTLRIDHHIFCEKIADTEIVDTSFESCCGLITEFAIKCRLTIPDIAAKALFTGMVTDSGRFRYDSTTSKTFLLAAELAKHEFSTNDIYRELYADDFEMIRLRASFVLKIRLTPKNVAYIYTTASELAELATDTFTVSRGMVGTMSDIRGVDIWVNFTETQSGVFCEIRSNKYNINPVAVKHGGGGHAKASGATLKDKAEAIQLLAELDAIKETENG